LSRCFYSVIKQILGNRWWDGPNVFYSVYKASIKKLGGVIGQKRALKEKWSWVSPIEMIFLFFKE
jgi:hypothetical protein